MLGLKLGLGLNRKVALSAGYDPDAQAFFAELPTQPETRVKNAYNNAFVNYPTVISLHDRLYVNGSEFQDNSLVSLVNPTSTDKSIIGCPTWSKFKGWTGATGAALNWNWKPSDGVNYTQNSACYWFYSNATVNALAIAMGATDAGEANGSEVYPSYSGTMYLDINDANFSSRGNTNTLGLISVVRINATQIQLWRNGVLIQTFASNVGTRSGSNMYELASNIFGTLSYPWIGQISDCGVCAGDVNQLDLYNMIEGIHGDMPLWSYYGDSITFGYGLTFAQSWASLLSTDKNYSAYNRAINGSTIADFVASGVTIRKKGFAGQKIFFGWGVNDCVEALGTTTFITNYTAVINAALAAGWSVNDIVITKRWYITDGAVLALYTPYVIAAQTVATSFGITNCYDLSPLAYSLQDALHPDAAGSLTIANYYNSIL